MQTHNGSSGKKKGLVVLNVSVGSTLFAGGSSYTWGGKSHREVGCCAGLGRSTERTSAFFSATGHLHYIFLQLQLSNIIVSLQL